MTGSTVTDDGRSAGVPGGVACTIGWGLFGASSWTWCIGMFLPTILLARFGWAGFWAFLIPNVLGCAGFGYFFDREASRRFATRHAAAVRWFSLATISFQVFFIGWACGSFVFVPTVAADALADDPGVAGAVSDTLVWPVLGTILTWTAAAIALGARSDRFWRWFATVAAVTSGTLFAIALRRAGGLPDASTPEGGASLLAAIPVITLGFLACPALDATFHRMRQQSPSRHAFAVFGVVFAAMLVFAALTFDELSPNHLAEAVLPFAIAQWTLQLVFTIGAHAREVPLLAGGRLASGPALAMAVAVGAIAGLPGLASESVYLSFLGLYAIPFPMYVIAALVAGEHPLRTRAIPTVIVMSVLLSPFAWIGFIENRTEALLLVAAVTAISAWMIGRFLCVRNLPDPAL